MPITLKELAAQAGVHPSTVSRIVNNDPRLRVSAATRTRVRELLKKTGYRPDGIARGLRLRHSRVVGVLIPDVLNPLFAGIFHGIEDAAVEHGYTVLLCSTDGVPERERDLLSTLQARRIDGVILCSTFLRDGSVRWLRRQHIPHVLVNRYSDLSDPFVGSDDEKGACLATQHLLSLGHTRIAHLAASQRISTGVLRRRGYIATLKAAGIEPDPSLIVDAGLVEDAGFDAVQPLLDRADPPTAIVAVNDSVAIGVYDACAARAIRIPHDIAVTGYNDIPLACRLYPGLTTVRVAASDLGRTSAVMLLQEIENGSPDPRRVVVDPELVVRGSTDPTKP